MRKILFVRHGQSVANVLDIVSNRHLNHPLTDEGRGQVAKLICQLTEQGLHPSSLWASTLLRASQTAALIATAFDLDFEVTDALKEQDCGVLEGEQIQPNYQQFIDMADRWHHHDDFDARIEGGESLQDMYDRVYPFLVGLIGGQGEANSLPLLVGHGATFTFTLPLICENLNMADTRQWRLKNCGLVVVVHKNGKFYCTEWDGRKLD